MSTAAKVFVSGMVLVACTQRAAADSIVLDDVNPTATTWPLRHGRVVLVTIDGARWQDVFEGDEALMPRTHALVATRGVALGATRDGCGIVRTAGGSNVSLPGYQEIFTGHASRCLDNLCSGV